MRSPSGRPSHSSNSPPPTERPRKHGPGLRRGIRTLGNQPRARAAGGRAHATLRGSYRAKTAASCGPSVQGSTIRDQRRHCPPHARKRDDTVTELDPERQPPASTDGQPAVGAPNATLPKMCHSTPPSHAESLSGHRSNDEITVRAVLDPHTICCITRPSVPPSSAF